MMVFLINHLWQSTVFSAVVGLLALALKQNRAPCRRFRAPRIAVKFIQEQLGLSLEPTKGPVDVLVVDHIEKPAEN